MNQLKNIKKVLLSLLIIVNLYTSFDFIISQEFNKSTNNIELIITLTHPVNDSIDFEQLKQSNSFYKPETFYNKKHNFYNQINNKNLLEQINFNAQKYTVLNFKPTLLQILINEISIQKSHCI